MCMPPKVGTFESGNNIALKLRLCARFLYGVTKSESIAASRIAARAAHSYLYVLWDSFAVRPPV